VLPLKLRRVNPVYFGPPADAKSVIPVPLLSPVIPIIAGPVGPFTTKELNEKDPSSKDVPIIPEFK